MSIKENKTKLYRRTRKPVDIIPISKKKKKFYPKRNHKPYELQRTPTKWFLMSL